MILPIIMIVICAGLGAGAYFFFGKSSKNTKVNESQESANEFNNVKDIRGKFLYTLNGMVISFIRINPISIDLYSKSEKQILIKLLTAELSSFAFPFKFIAVSRPIDISPLITELTDLLENADDIQKELLKKELAVMNSYTSSGEVVERRFYISVWCKYGEGCERDLHIKAKDICGIFESGGLHCDIAEEDEIIKLIGLINNPSYAHLEDMNFSDEMPIVDYGKGNENV